jgi:hypothetical protein
VGSDKLSSLSATGDAASPSQSASFSQDPTQPSISPYTVPDMTKPNKRTKNTATQHALPNLISAAAKLFHSSDHAVRQSRHDAGGAQYPAPKQVLALHAIQRFRITFDASFTGLHHTGEGFGSDATRARNRCTAKVAYSCLLVFRVCVV